MKGLTAERLVARELRAAGYLVASRRHFGGAGDILAIHPTLPARLVEVKATKRKPWHSSFGPADRGAMLDTASSYGTEAWLAWVRGSRVEWIAPSEWPK